MKNRSIVTIASLCIMFAVPVMAQMPVYHANLMGLSDGRTNLQMEHVTGLNSWGQVIGTYGGGLSGGTHAVLWTPPSANDGSGNAIDAVGRLFTIESSAGMPAGTADTGPTGLNDRGQIAGWAFTPGQGDGNQLQSWMWKPKTLNSLKGVLHGNSGKAVAFPLLSIPGFGSASQYNQIINNQGAIASHGISYRPVLWTPAGPNGTTGTWTYDSNHGAPPSAFNDAGQIAGSSCESSVWNGPYLHSGAFPPLLDTDILSSPLWIPPTAQECVGSVGGMNAKGDLGISAISISAGAVHSYLYKNGVAADLSPTIQNGATAEAYSINSFDQIVGHMDLDTRRAALFQNGQMLDLNTLNDSTNGLLLKYAISINDAGQILAFGVYPGGTGASILLTPNALVINKVTIKPGPLQHSGSNYTQTITVTNKGTTTISGPISVALDSLNPAVTLTNASGTTVYTGPGSVYANVSTSDLAAGATTALFTLEFSNPSHVAIKYQGRALGTSAPR